VCETHYVLDGDRSRAGGGTDPPLAFSCAYDRAHDACGCQCGASVGGEGGTEVERKRGERGKDWKS
jgi:hypothetical protein